MTAQDFFMAIETRYRERYPYERRGQAAFNTLALMNSDLAEKVRGSQLDPFYNDDVLPAFCGFVAVSWDAPSDTPANL
jgi:hypothetical protein